MQGNHCSDSYFIAPDEARMKWLQTHLEEILDSIADSVLITDRDSNIVFVNSALLNFCDGLSKEAVLNKKCSALFRQCASPCPKECIADIVCPHPDIFSTGKSLSFVRAHTLPDGSERFFTVTASPIRDDGGDIIYSIAVLREITDEERTKRALQESEEKYRRNEEFISNILESMGAGLVVIDRDYRILAANKAYCKQVDMPCDSILGKNCFEISHHGDKPCFECGEDCAAQRTFETGEPHQVVHTHFDSSGGAVYVELKSYPMRNRAGNIVSVIEVLNDITEKKGLEDQLRHAQKMEAVGTLTGGIAHDFNNILTAMIGYASILQLKMKADDPLLSNVRQILASAERASGLTRSLLAFSRKQPLNPKPVNLNELIKGAETLLSRLISEDIAFETMLTEQDLPILADHGQLSQVLMNMVTNARDAMPGGGKLTITTSPVILDKDFLAPQDGMKPGLYALAAISDNGMGMDDKTREKIFEPFFTTKEVGKGTGLGLAMVYGIIKQHGGMITVSSEPRRGTTFKIYLPLYRSETHELEAPSKPGAAAMGGTETFLVAEDNEAVRTVITTVLAEAGYGVVEAETGEEAVRKYIENKDRIHILLLDVTMPKKNGFAVYEEIKRSNPDIKTIFMSGYNDLAVNSNGTTKEGVMFLSKPVAPSELLRAVRKALDT
jgi:PAS domain S-box-containing protein